MDNGTTVAAQSENKKKNSQKLCILGCVERATMSSGVMSRLRRSVNVGRVVVNALLTARDGRALRRSEEEPRNR